MSIKRLGNHFNKAIQLAEVNTEGFKEGAKECFKGFLAKRIRFAGAAVEGALNTVGTLALAVGSLFSAVISNSFDAVSNMTRLHKPWTSIKLGRDLDISLTRFRASLTQGCATVISLVGVVAPIGAVKLHHFFSPPRTSLRRL